MKKAKSKRNTGRIRAVFFDLDDTLFDSAASSRNASMNAVAAMIDAGLPAKSRANALDVLEKIKEKFGSNYPMHYDELCKSCGLKGGGIDRIVAVGQRGCTRGRQA
jgi:phosphoglycolate phosphatase-like HAD superfamily hydrolase